MRKLVLFIISMLLLASIFFLAINFNKHIDMTLEVKIDSNIDKISFYRIEDGSVLVTSIEPKGKDVNTTIKLYTGNQYYFKIYKGTEINISKEIGFSNRQRGAILTVRGINSYSIESIN
ncbi:MAG: hypothetical protein FH753_04725 [Firmicutes bacterium]|nr:hypothetical protein [Bacillota bacterium]